MKGYRLNVVNISYFRVVEGKEALTCSFEISKLLVKSNLLISKIIITHIKKSMTNICKYILTHP